MIGSSADEVERLRAEVQQLRSLIAAWADAYDLWGSEGLDITEQRLEETSEALRQAVGR